jgi:molybdenum cofactor cytidylyltransferase
MTGNRIAAIILAAGGSSRLGRPKQLLDWFGKSFVKHLVDFAHQLKLDPVVVVTGANYQEIETTIVDERIVIARNMNWQNGQSSSMQVGCKALEEYQIDGFIVFLCDQPQVSSDLIEKMKIEAQREDVEIVATTVGGKVCPPTLFKSICLPSIMTLKGDQGGKALFELHNTQKVKWTDERLFQDTDTEEDYLKLIKLYSI